jgi:hypothetical protein
MAEAEPPFRFLSDKEFLTLSVSERTAYLSRASRELEARQKLLRDQRHLLKRDVGNE